MSVSSQQVLEDVMRVLGDIDELVKAAASAENKAASDPALDMKLAAVRARIDRVQEAVVRKVRNRVTAVDGYFRDNTWKTVGAATAIAFIAGLLVGRPSSE
jgi:ElaB/YqjD/DUF883 family membrane-anchored ribosome-binding protein